MGTIFQGFSSITHTFFPWDEWLFNSYFSLPHNLSGLALVLIILFYSFIILYFLSGLCASLLMPHIKSMVKKRAQQAIFLYSIFITFSCSQSSHFIC